MESELPFSDHGYYGEDEEEDDKEKEEEEESDGAFLSIFNQRTEWTDWGTLQHEAALGCQVHWQEWLVAFSPAWESPFLVFDCGRADKFVEGVLGVEELWNGVVGWKSCEEEEGGKAFLELCRGGDEPDLDHGRRSRDDEFPGSKSPLSRGSLLDPHIFRAMSTCPGLGDDDTWAAGRQACFVPKDETGLGHLSAMLFVFCIVVVLWVVDMSGKVRGRDTTAHLRPMEDRSFEIQKRRHLYFYG